MEQLPIRIVHGNLEEALITNLLNMVGMGMDLKIFDLKFGWFNDSGVHSSSTVVTIIHPFSFKLGEYFFIRPTAGAGFYHSEMTVSKKTDKSNGFDLLLFPKVGFVIPLKNGRGLTIYASYRYDVVNFKFEGKGTWGIGVGIIQDHF